VFQTGSNLKCTMYVPVSVKERERECAGRGRCFVPADTVLWSVSPTAGARITSTVHVPREELHRAYATSHVHVKCAADCNKPEYQTDIPPGTPSSYSGGPGFESRSIDGLSRMRVFFFFDFTQYVGRKEEQNIIFFHYFRTLLIYVVMELLVL
jgi:hypothetical protein